MKVVIIANCVTAGYHGAVAALFPDWEVKAAGYEEANRWLETGEKPHFSQYLRECDLFLGFDSPTISATLRQGADRILVPGLHFRGLHPDVVELAGLWGPFSEGQPHTQTSLIVLGAKALGLAARDVELLFRDEIYERLDFYRLYASERDRICAEFAASGIPLDDAFDEWSKRGDSFHICHHPRGFVLVDIMRCALKDRYLTPEAFAGSRDLGDRLPDTLAWSEAWPVYPDIASRHGFEGGLTWLKSHSHQPREMPLRQVVELIYGSLDRMERDWKQAPFVAECARLIAA